MIIVDNNIFFMCEQWAWKSQIVENGGKKRFVRIYVGEKNSVSVAV